MQGTVATLILLAQLVCIIHGDAKFFLPVDYITPRNMAGTDMERFIFTMEMCGGSHLHDSTANLFVNLPDKHWMDQGVTYLKVKVMDKDGSVIASNDDKGTFLQDISFKYLEKYGDLKISAEVGPTSNLVFTINVHFILSPASLNAQKGKIRTHTTYEETLATANFRKNAEKYPKTKAYAMAQIVKTKEALDVMTFQSRSISILYCINPARLPKTLTVDIIADDAKSAFNTYGCINVDECTFDVSVDRDTSGSSVNQVHLPLKTYADLEKPVSVRVDGNGRHEENNHFIVSSPVNR